MAFQAPKQTSYDVVIVGGAMLVSSVAWFLSDNPDFDGQPGRLANKDFIDGKLNESFMTNTSRHWLVQLVEKRIPCAPVNKFSQALNDKQVLHRNMVIDLKHPDGQVTKGPGNPLKFSRTNEESFSPAPKLGQDSDEVLAGLLDMGAEEIARLRETGVII